MLKAGRETSVSPANDAGTRTTSTGNHGLMLEEPLLFEREDWFGTASICPRRRPL